MTMTRKPNLSVKPASKTAFVTPAMCYTKS